MSSPARPLLVCAATVLASALPCSSHAAGGESFFIDLAGKVAGNCRITSSGPYALSLTLDPGSGADITASTSAIRFWCTKGVAFAVTDDGGLRGTHEMVGPDSESIPYTLDFTPSRTVGAGPANPITLTITGSVAFASFSDRQVGTYTDRVTVTVNP